MNETCGCCEGVEKITPVTIANRPGLDALIYRVGTHASFLETMKARLSKLGLTLADIGIVTDVAAGGGQLLYPLRSLTTRAAYDPAIALLDAWAIVADVLTFYQERIANEGYLRTATERRSILELARLVGYTLRPGVSASVFLAYTLEVGPETTIAAGNRAQSLPGPGETPQPFETSDKLVARAKWNDLQPRLTRPQFITQDNADTIDTLYFQGAATGLKPNDPLLLIFNVNTPPTVTLPGQPVALPGQFVRYVQAVEPQAAENRTKVTLQDIVTVATLSTAIQQTIERYLDLPAFCVSQDDPLFNAAYTIVHALLTTLQTLQKAVPPAKVDDILLALGGAVGSQQDGLQGVFIAASNQGDAHAANWLDGLVNDLENILRRALAVFPIPGIVEVPPVSIFESKTSLFVPAQQASGSVAAVAAQVSGPPSPNASNGFKSVPSRLPDLVASLSKPASQQPANSAQLVRSVSQAFGTQSDILPQILTTLNPALKPTLYPAVSNAVVTLPSGLQSAQALRVKATPFGSNAPLKPITNEKGIVVGHEEWPIANSTAIEVVILPPSSIGAQIAGNTLFLDMLTKAGQGTFLQALISIKQDEQTLSSQVALDKPIIHASVGGVPVNISMFIALLRFAHAMSDVGAMDIYIDEILVVEKLSFGEVSKYIAATPGDYSLQDTKVSARHRLKFTKAGLTEEVTFTQEVPLPINREATTLVAVGTEQNAQSRILHPLEDILFPPQTGQARLRIIDASTLGTLTVNFSGEAHPIKLDIGHMSSFDVKADITYNLTVNPENDTTKVLLNLDFTLKAGSIYDILLFDDGTGLLSKPLAQPIEVPGLFPGEVFRLLFAFPQQKRKFKIIGAQTNIGGTLATRNFIAQVADDGDSDDDNDGLFLTQHFTKTPATQVYSTTGRNIVMNLGENVLPFSISDEALEAVPVNQRKTLALDAKFDQVTPGSWVVIERPDRTDPTKNEQIISRVLRTETPSIAQYGISGTVTRLTLDKTWLGDKDVSLATLRQVTVYAQSVARDLAEESIDPIKESICGDQIELDDVYGGLQSGRWLIVAGERTDILGSNGVRGAELVMLAGVKQGVHQVLVSGSSVKGDARAQAIDLPGDTTHTFLTLANALSYSYKRDTVTVYGNVVHATHGETRNEVLGSGDGSKELQQFALRQSPLTYLSAPTPAGAASTLKVYVNNIEWHETDNLAGLGPTERKFITQTDDNDKTSAIFGNGERGARLPTGVENVKATYRTGIGKPGNVDARKISLLATRPLGVKSVINPLPATGGADRESIDQARRNVPVAVLALDRLVSVQDYADFARTYAGIGKASAARLSDGRRQLVHLTIAGADNIPIDVNSDLYLNLFQSLRQSGDPNEPLQVALADVSLLVIQAGLRLLPDYQLESVEPQIRTALLNVFGFEQRELGQPVFQSEVISVIQGVEGVDYVRLEVMGAVSQQQILDALTKIAQNPPVPPETETGVFLKLLNLTSANDIVVALAQFIQAQNRIAPAQLAFLSPDVPDALILGEILDERKA
ncbi:MAG: hypothetical protein NVSMB27_02390 [Ktedonobacteraceae bacterium]